jgi:hypothetical protein
VAELVELLREKVEISGKLRDLDNEQFDADGPDPSDENDSEEQQLLRIRLYEIDEELEKHRVFDVPKEDSSGT